MLKIFSKVFSLLVISIFVFSFFHYDAFAIILGPRGGLSEGTYACVADDGRYACSPGAKNDCSDVPDNACAGKQCFPLSDTSKCGQIALDVGGEPGGDVGGGPGKSVNFIFEIPNPIAAESFTDLINAIGRFIFNISIPIAVILIIVSGLKFLLSGGKPEKVAEAKKMLTYTLIGLTIIFIGKGFVTLIKSILDLGK